jgi:hypothetical protein
MINTLIAVHEILERSLRRRPVSPTNRDRANRFKTENKAANK